MTVRRSCGCGWPKPLFAITTPSGQAPAGELLVRVVCPACGTAYTASELDEREVGDAQRQAAAGRAIDLRRLL